MSPQEQQQYPDGSNKYSYTIGDDDQMSMFPEALEDTTQDQRIYVTLPESKPLHVPYTAQHRFGPVLRFLTNDIINCQAPFNSFSY